MRLGATQENSPPLPALLLFFEHAVFQRQANGTGICLPAQSGKVIGFSAISTLSKIDLTDSKSSGVGIADELWWIEIPASNTAERA